MNTFDHDPQLKFARQILINQSRGTFQLSDNWTRHETSCSGPSKVPSTPQRILGNNSDPNMDYL